MVNKNNKSGGQARRSKDIKKRFWSFGEGDFLATWFTGRNLQWVIALSLLALFLVYNNYAAMNRMRQVNELKRQVNELRLEQVSISSTLMGAGRISAVELRVEQEALPIAIPKTSPIVIKEK